MKPILSFANYSSSTFLYLLIYLACLGWLNQVIDHWCVYMVNDERPPFPPPSSLLLPLLPLPPLPFPPAHRSPLPGAIKEGDVCWCDNVHPTTFI